MARAVRGIIVKQPTAKGSPMRLSRCIPSEYSPRRSQSNTLNSPLSK